jgi:hypothetical protein
MHATTAALALLAQAATALERHAHPSAQDVEEALGAAKDAAKILKASLDLLGDGIYTVTDEPDPGQPLPFDSAEVVSRGRR